MESIIELAEPTPVDLGDLLDAVDGAMVTVVAGDTHLVAHRAVLAERSPEFAARFRHSMQETQLAIPAMEGAVLRQLLAYLYTLQTPQRPRMASQLLAAADQCGLPVLKAQCEQQVIAQLAVQNSASAAVLAIVHSCKSLRQASVNFMRAHIHKVLGTRGWADAVRTQPTAVVEVSRLLSETPAETSSSPVSESSTTKPTEEVKETTAMDLGALLDAGDGAVVTLVAADTQLVAHRAVLADRSPVFAAQFHQDMLEASSDKLTVPDVEGPVLRQLLTYLYTLQAPQMRGMASQLLAAADKYGLLVLKTQCEQQVAAQLAGETVASTADLAVKHSCDLLRQDNVNFIKSHIEEVARKSLTDAVLTQPEDVIEVSQLLSRSPTETRTPAITDRRPVFAIQSHSDLKDRSRSPSPATSPMAARRPQQDDAAASRQRILSEKSKRLIETAKLGAVEELRALLAAGANVRKRDWDRTTALHHAAERGHVEAVRHLLDAGAELDAKNQWGNTPLHRAAIGGHASVVQLLVTYSADPNARNEDGWTPLHSAALNGHSEAVTALLEAGADREARTNSGKTPLDIAREYNGLRVVDML